MKSDNKKIVIYKRPSWRWSGIGNAAHELGVSRTAVSLYLSGRTETLSKEKRDRIVVKTVQPKKGGAK